MLQLLIITGIVDTTVAMLFQQSYVIKRLPRFIGYQKADLWIIGLSSWWSASA